MSDHYTDYDDRPIVKGSKWIGQTIALLLITCVIFPAIGFFVWYSVSEILTPVLAPEIAPAFTSKWHDTGFFVVGLLLGWGMEAVGLLIVKSLIRKPKEGEREWE